MKKLIVGFVAAIMMAAGLVAISGTSAVAACPYTNCVDTFTSINARQIERTNRRGRTNCTKKARIQVQVRTNGNDRPSGKVQITIRNSKGQFVYNAVDRLNKWGIGYATAKLKRGQHYTIGARYERKAGSVYKDSDNVAGFFMKRKKACR